MTTMQQQLGRAYRTAFDRAYGESICNFHPSEDKEELFKRVKNCARYNANRLACEHTAFISLESPEYKPRERSSLLRGEIPESYLHGDGSVITREGLTKLMTFLSQSHNTELNDQLGKSLINLLSQNLRVIPTENYPYGNVLFYIKSSGQEAAGLFLDNDSQSVRDKIKLFDIEAYLRAEDSYRQFEIDDEAYDKYLKDTYCDHGDVIRNLINRLHWNTDVEAVVLALVRLQNTVRAYADTADKILHPDHQDLPSLPINRNDDIS